MRKTLSILFTLALVLSFSLVATTPVAAAQIWYVDPTGTDAPGQGTGPGAAAFQTIQYAVGQAGPGDTIMVGAGTYTEAVDIGVPNLTLQSSGGRDVTIVDNPSVGSETPGIRVQANLGVVTVEGFTVNYFRNGITQGMAASGGTSFIVRNNKVIPENNATDPYLRNGIQVTGEGSQVIGNHVVGAPLTSDWSSTGIGVVNAKNVLVEDNIVNTGGADIGINIFNYSADLVENITVHRNTVIGAGNGIRFEGNYWAGPPWDKKIQDVVIDSNVVSGCERGINHLWVTLGDITITNNHIHDSSIAGVRLASSVTLTGTVAINYNSIEDNNPWGLLNETGTGVDATLNWWGDDSGPTHISNIGGSGDAVSDNVDFTPWIKKSVETVTGTGTASFVPSHGAIVDLVAVAAPSLPSVSFPHGMFSFKIMGITPGQTVDVTITLPSAVPVGTVWWKYDNGRWHSLPNLNDNGDNVMVIRPTDGGTGDMDGVANGIITSTQGSGNPMTVGWDGSPVSRAAVVAPWIALLAAMVAGASLLVWRRRRSEV